MVQEFLCVHPILAGGSTSAHPLHECFQTTGLQGKISAILTLWGDRGWAETRTVLFVTFSAKFLWLVSSDSTNPSRPTISRA